MVWDEFEFSEDDSFAFAVSPDADEEEHGYEGEFPCEVEDDEVESDKGSDDAGF